MEKSKGQEQWDPEKFREYYGKKKAMEAQGARMKYNNVKQEIDGIRFDSTKEAKYYGTLKLRVKAGEVEKFEVHAPFPLVVNGVLVCTYVADFVIYYPGGRVSVVDVKGSATEGLSVFRIKKNLMAAIHKISVQIV